MPLDRIGSRHFRLRKLSGRTLQGVIAMRGTEASRLALAAGAALVAFCAGDLAWLGFVARDLYAHEIGALLKPPDLVAAALFYALYLTGLVLYAVRGASESASPIAGAGRRGAAFGFFCYMSYDLTNLATLAGWSRAITAIDIAWGTVLSASAAMVGAAVLAARRPRDKEALRP